jgi:hypothetical protein
MPLSGNKKNKIPGIKILGQNLENRVVARNQQKRSGLFAGSAEAIGVFAFLRIFYFYF